MLSQGHDREVIAAELGITKGQVSAIAAHITMGTYGPPLASGAVPPNGATPVHSLSPVVQQVLEARDATTTRTSRDAGVAPVFLGEDLQKNEAVFWNPDPDHGAANPHTLIVGESGFGKTYAISSLLAELKQQGILSLVFDYGQGFSPDAAPAEFTRYADPVGYPVNRAGADVNPLCIFPSDLLGPVNVAQRVADTFARVYPKIGTQQHAVLRQAVLDAMADSGIRPEEPETWSIAAPAFSLLKDKLNSLSDGASPQAKVAAAVASHVSTMFVYNTFRSGGRSLAWSKIFADPAQVIVLQLKGLEHSLERAVTEFLLWNFIGFVESLGPSPLRCFVVLDEAHRLSFDPGSPVEKLLREGRKFGIGLMLASQQPQDFTPVAWANTATKLVFQVGDERYAVSHQLQRKLRNFSALGDVSALITRLPRGVSLFVSENVGRVIRIANFQERAIRWGR